MAALVTRSCLKIRAGQENKRVDMGKDWKSIQDAKKKRKELFTTLRK